MKKLFILVLLSLLTSGLPAQNWVLVNTISSPGVRPSISVPDINTVWIADGSSNSPKIFRSIDGGTNFTQISTTGIAQEIYCVWGISSMDCFVGEGEVNGNARLFRTTNGGTNWTSVLTTPGNGGYFNGLAFTKANGNLFGLAIAERVFRTSNNGINWVEINAGVNGVSNAQNSLMIVDNNFYGFGLNNGASRIRLTTNNGVVWDMQNVGLTGNYTSAIAFHSNKFLGVAATSSSLPSIARTTDGGITWSTVNIGSGPIGSCYFNWIPYGPVVYVLGANGVIKRSTDNGLTWVTTPTPVANLTHFDFVQYGNIVVGYAVSSNGSVIKLADTLSVLTSNGNHNAETPNEFSLSQNYPNPFNPISKIKYQITKLSAVRLSVYDIMGREIASLVNAKQDAGTYEITFDGSNFASGIYYYKLIAGDGSTDSPHGFVETKKMVLIK